MEAEGWKTGLLPNWSFPKPRRAEWRSLREGKAKRIRVGKEVREQQEQEEEETSILRQFQEGRPQQPHSWVPEGRKWCGLEQDWRKVGFVLRTRQTWFGRWRKDEGLCPREEGVV